MTFSIVDSFFSTVHVHVHVHAECNSIARAHPTNYTLTCLIVIHVHEKKLEITDKINGINCKLKIKHIIYSYTIHHYKPHLREMAI